MKKNLLFLLITLSALIFLFISPIPALATDSEAVGSTNWSYQSIECTYNHDINYVRVLIYRVGSPTTMHLDLFNEDLVTYTPTGLSLASCTADVSTVTTDPIGEWISLPLNAPLSMTSGLFYDLVMTQEAAGGGDYIVWLTTIVAGNGWYGHSHDSGATWDIDFNIGPPFRDALYELWNNISVITDFIATPISCSRIDLTWHDPNTPIIFPTFTLIIEGQAGSYPDDPPSLTDSSFPVYNKPVIFGNITTSSTNLLPGTTYYYNLWQYDSLTLTYNLAGQDFATTYSCPSTTNPNAPDTWYQEPTCDMYYNTVLWPAMNYVIGSYQFPAKYFCMIVTYFLISICALASFPIARMATQSPKSMVVPFIVIFALMCVCAATGAIPLGISIITLIAIGGLAVFIWNKA